MPASASPPTPGNPQARCRQHRRRILEISQSLGALHVGPAFSCLEIVDAVLYDCMDTAFGAQTHLFCPKDTGLWLPMWLWKASASLTATC